MSIPCTVSSFFRQERLTRGRMNALVDAELSVVRCQREVVLVANVTDDENKSLAGLRTVTVIPVGMIPEYIEELRAAMRDAADCGNSAQDWIRYKRVHRLGRSQRATTD